MRINTLLLAGFFVSGLANADSTLIYNDQDGKEFSRMLLSDDKVMITNNSETNTGLIFDQINSSFTIINHDDKSFMIFDQKQLEALGDVSKMVDKMINEQLAQMPEAQREQMRGMMESMIKNQMPKQTPLPKYSKSGQTDSYNGFDCEIVVKESKGKSDEEFCVTTFNQLGVSENEYNTIRDFMKIAEKMAAQFGQDQSMNFDSIGQVLPVYYKILDDKAFLTEVDNGNLPDNAFNVPASYKQQSLPKELF